jgi:hypothetical protein
MNNFLKKLQGLVRRPEVGGPQTETGERGKPAGRREPQKEVVAPPSQASAPMPAASAATPDSAKKRQPLDANRVNLTDPWEVQYRRKQFGCTELQLKQAVAAVGDSADKVRLFLRQKSVPPKGGKQRYE